MTNERYKLLKNVRLINAPEKKTDGCDLLFSCKEGRSRIVKIGKDLHLPEGAEGDLLKTHGALVCPSFTDLRCLIPECGGSVRSSEAQRETPATGLLAAEAGGYGRVLLSGGVSPIPDEPKKLQTVLQNCRKASSVEVFVGAPLTEGRRGEKLCDFEALRAAGARALCADRDCAEPDLGKLLQALRFAEENGMLFIAPNGEKSLDGAGSVNKGRISALCKDKGIDPLSELFALDRAILLAKATGAKVHFPIVTLKAGVDAVRKAKREGVRITCGTAPFYFSFNESEILLSGSNAKLLPPLRREEDRLALIEGLADGTVDCICSDHNPRTASEKQGGISAAAFGAVGLETAFGAGITHLVLPGRLTLYRLIELMAIAPARLLGIDPSLCEGARADFIFIDPDAEMVYDKNTLRSRCSNTPFRALKGRVTGLYVNGNRVFFSGKKSDYRM